MTSAKDAFMGKIDHIKREKILKMSEALSLVMCGNSQSEAASKCGVNRSDLNVVLKYTTKEMFQHVLAKEHIDRLNEENKVHKNTIKKNHVENYELLEIIKTYHRLFNKSHLDHKKSEDRTIFVEAITEMRYSFLGKLMIWWHREKE